MWLSAFIVNPGGATVTQCDSRLVGAWVDDFERVAGQFRFTTPWLKPGSYRVDLFICAAGLFGRLGGSLFPDDLSSAAVC